MNKILKILTVFYKKTFSRMLVLFFGKGCRFYPTCSDYSRESLEKFGVIQGLLMSAKRILRCHPFSKAVYYDPLPDK